MVTRVWLVRHGEARATPEGGERPLTAAGRAQADRLAQWCLVNEIRPHDVRHSGVLRAAETARILAARLAPPGGVRAVRGLAPDDDARSWANDLPHETRSTMLVTHMPFVGELSSLLGGRAAPEAFATCEIACFEKDGAGFQFVGTWTP
jgi:phosphohistidine phosphatase